MVSMLRIPGWCWSALALVLVLRSVSIAADESSFVVLRSGGVLEGVVTVRGERYVVAAPNRTIEVPAARVLLVAPSMDAAYEQQRQSLSQDRSEPHLRLAEWCVRYELFTQAEQEIDNARQIDPRDPALNLLERRLAVVRKPAAAPASRPAPNPQELDASKIELQELEAAASDLPKAAVERFTRRVQPLLVNNCTASGCHQSGGEQSFQLDRAVLHGVGNRRITLRNLTATLELIDRDSPARSELLAMARRTHGGMDHAAFGSRQKSQLKQLTEWVNLVAGTSAAPAPFAKSLLEDAASIQFSESAVLDTIPSQFLDRNVQPAEYTEETPSAALPSQVKFGADLRPWQPKDEFDPEIFNRAQRHEASQ